MQSEDSQSKLIELAPRRQPNGLKRWTVVLGLIGAAGLAMSYVYPLINWPWAPKADVEHLEAEVIDIRQMLIRFEEQQKGMPAAVADEIERRHRRR